MIEMWKQADIVAKVFILIMCTSPILFSAVGYKVSKTEKAPSAATE
ncbi:hypothetical protein RH915_05870 [Serpentinicella sp. ANB-PHB4]|nr:hypothetical protein [Serpentinicella sp. ANB-PHB4]MDR5659010.1 hypothetical protein [Serpentinicella sp. ANB-PHB4]